MPNNNKVVLLSIIHISSEFKFKVTSLIPLKEIKELFYCNLGMMNIQKAYNITQNSANYFQGEKKGEILYLSPLYPSFK